MHTVISHSRSYTRTLQSGCYCAYTTVQAEVLALFSQGIAEPGGQGRVASALACLQVLPCEKGHYYYQLIKHYCQKRNLNALKRIQSALTGDDRWQTFQQVPEAPW